MKLTTTSRARRQQGRSTTRVWPSSREQTRVQTRQGTAKRRSDFAFAWVRERSRVRGTRSVVILQHKWPSDCKNLWRASRDRATSYWCRVVPVHLFPVATAPAEARAAASTRRGRSAPSRLLVRKRALRLTLQESQSDCHRLARSCRRWWSVSVAWPIASETRLLRVDYRASRPALSRLCRSRTARQWEKHWPCTTRLAWARGGEPVAASACFEKRGKQSWTGLPHASFRSTWPDCKKRFLRRRWV